MTIKAEYDSDAVVDLRPKPAQPAPPQVETQNRESFPTVATPGEMDAWRAEADARRAASALPSNWAYQLSYHAGLPREGAVLIDERFRYLMEAIDARLSAIEARLAKLEES